MEQLLAHLWGDYILQSHWMANEKTKRMLPAVIHGVCYTLPFILLTRSAAALAVIFLTHVAIDRYRLANWVSRLKNGCWTASGYPDDTPPWLWVWLMIAADNTMHLTINYLSISLL
jgi:hypothetical protein